MSKNLVIVESPAKAKTISKYLGKDFEVMASYGHVRDLVPKEGAVDPNNEFAMKYQVIERSEKHVNAIVRALKKADAATLARAGDAGGVDRLLYEVEWEPRPLNGSGSPALLEPLEVATAGMGPRFVELSREHGFDAFAELEPRLDEVVATYVAEDNGEILGTYYIKPNQPALGAHVCNCGYIVSENVRGKGIASEMCEHSQREALTLGFKSMQYNLVVSTNETAIHLWKKQGFEVIGTLPEAFRHPQLGLVDALVMYKILKT